jgi:hypothetical protein
VGIVPQPTKLPIERFFCRDNAGQSLIFLLRVKIRPLPSHGQGIKLTVARLPKNPGPWYGDPTAMFSAFFSFGRTQFPTKNCAAFLRQTACFPEARTSCRTQFVVAVGKKGAWRPCIIHGGMFRI